MSLDPSRTLNLPNSGPALKIVEEPFSVTITENKWFNALKKEAANTAVRQQEKAVTIV